MNIYKLSQCFSHLLCLLQWLAENQRTPTKFENRQRREGTKVGADPWHKRDGWGPPSYLRHHTPLINLIKFRNRSLVALPDGNMPAPNPACNWCYCGYWVCSKIPMFVEVVAGTRFSFTLLVGRFGLFGFWVWGSRFCLESTKSKSTTGLISFIFCKLRAFDAFCFSEPPFLCKKTMYVYTIHVINRQTSQLFPLQADNDISNNNEL